MLGVLRRVTRDGLLSHLESIPAARFHWVRWNGEPVRLEQAQGRAHLCDAQTWFYVRGEQILGPLELDSLASWNGRASRNGPL